MMLGSGVCEFNHVMLEDRLGKVSFFGKEISRLLIDESKSIMLVEYGINLRSKLSTEAERCNFSN